MHVLTSAAQPHLKGCVSLHYMCECVCCYYFANPSTVSVFLSVHVRPCVLMFVYTILRFCMRAYLFPFLSYLFPFLSCVWTYLFFVCPLLWVCTTSVRTHARTHAESTRTPLSCGGDECDDDSLSFLRQWYIQTCILVYMCINLFVFCFFAFLKMPDSCLPNSLFLLDTRSLDLSLNQLSILSAGSFGGLLSLQWVCVFFVAVTEYWAWVKVLGLCECVYVWVYMTTVWPHIKSLLYMDSTSALYIQASGHTDVHVQTDRQTQWMDWRNSSSTHTRTCSSQCENTVVCMLH
jgi:hypothetical protein